VEIFGQHKAPLAAETVKCWVPATTKGQPVTDLRKEDLQLSIGKQKQSVSALTFNPPEPMRVGLLIDASGSQRTQWGHAISLVPNFFNHVIRPGDQGFIAHFNDRYYMDAPPSSDLRVLDQSLKRLGSVRPYGGSPIYDAIIAACYLRTVGEPTHHVLVVITDGSDTASRVSSDQAIAEIGKTSTQLYVVGTGSHDPERLHAERVFRSLVGINGGFFVSATDNSELESALNSIAELLRAQYELEFQPEGVSPGKKGNSIRIKCSRRGVHVTCPEQY
jgi:VWFA-related protein